MNFPLGREIYGGEPWMVDRSTFMVLFNQLRDFRNGVKFGAESEKLNGIYLIEAKSGTKLVTDPWQLKYNEKEDSLIYVINLNGAITKNGGESSYGTKELSQRIARFDADKNVIGGIILTDSGGGSTSGMQYMAYAIKQAKKPIVGLVERGGMAASAAYGILSNTDWIMSEAADNTVGSIGTMISFSAHPNKSVDGDNAKHITIYASASTKKNLAFEEAINNDNYELIINELLDPVNERFLGMIRENRSAVLESHLDGSVYDAGDVLGTLVDEIGDFNAAVTKVKQLSASKYFSTKLSSSTSNTKNKAMTVEEIKNQHPEAYAQILGIGHTAGVKTESERTKVWLAHVETDPEAVIKGIKDGEEISASQREEFLIKASTNSKLKALKSDSAKKLNTEESEGETQKTELQSYFDNVKKGVQTIKN